MPTSSEESPGFFKNGFGAYAPLSGCAFEIVPKPVRWLSKDVEVDRESDSVREGDSRFVLTDPLA
ncbi:MAG: hypothetical protein P1U87_07010 [Verrucomicrobiales bacterium]|nr:hypothetical protein [Verrucomicrobiales bacterium]